ncbi:winged helix-turn-helix transcriptional regulator [Thermobifida halotolerans]|uniref:Winged helix-turn-helix transcriptional regulator n=1 Tax=Thermobifida halotolerans TaxID=483545 RepID=A0A399G5U0_9ACTN|nr:MarR family winged helix-turn-helix transcriptional regulator [Thermobifida halotolerans]UOE21029.1 winged helix-turn-helix transcriptional regulator [Thermobifida halotolerans]
MTADPTETPPRRLSGLPSRLLTQTAAHVHRLVTHGLGDFRTHHYALMAALAEAGPSSQAVLGRRCGMDRSDVTAAVTELASRGLLRRTVDPAHRRRNIVALTAEGENALRELDQRVQRLQDEAFAPLTPTERAHLAELLTRLLDHHTRP